MYGFINNDPAQIPCLSKNSHVLFPQQHILQHGRIGYQNFGWSQPNCIPGIDLMIERIDVIVVLVVFGRIPVISCKTQILTACRDILAEAGLLILGQGI